MGTLTIPYTLLYEGVQNPDTGLYRSGLMDVRCLVLKPDKSIVGVFPMMELPPPFTGRYSFDYQTSSSDPEGEYFAYFVSPTEGVQRIFRFSLYKGALSPSILAGMTAVKGFVEQNRIIGEIEPIKMVRGYVEIPEPMIGIDEEGEGD